MAPISKPGIVRPGQFFDQHSGKCCQIAIQRRGSIFSVQWRQMAGNFTPRETFGPIHVEQDRQEYCAQRFTSTGARYPFPGMLIAARLCCRNVLIHATSFCVMSKPTCDLTDEWGPKWLRIPQYYELVAVIEPFYTFHSWSTIHSSTFCYIHKKHIWNSATNSVFHRESSYRLLIYNWMSESEGIYSVIVERSPPAFQINFPRLWPSTV